MRFVGAGLLLLTLLPPRTDDIGSSKAPHPFRCACWCPHLVAAAHDFDPPLHVGVSLAPTTHRGCCACFARVRCFSFSDAAALTTLTFARITHFSHMDLGLACGHCLLLALPCTRLASALTPSCFQLYGPTSSLRFGRCRDSSSVYSHHVPFSHGTRPALASGQFAACISVLAADLASVCPVYGPFLFSIETFTVGLPLSFHRIHRHSSPSLSRFILWAVRLSSFFHTPFFVLVTHATIASHSVY